MEVIFRKHVNTPKEESHLVTDPNGDNKWDPAKKQNSLFPSYLNTSNNDENYMIVYQLREKIKIKLTMQKINRMDLSSQIMKN